MSSQPRPPLIINTSFPKPVFLDLFLTDDCNCRCDYCFVGRPGKKTRLSYPAAKRTVDYLLEEWERAEDLGILLFGGEPLLEFDLIRYIVEYAERRALSGAPAIGWSMTTNGTLMTEPMMAFLAEHRIRYLLSLDGSQETHNLHRKLKNGIGSFNLLAKRLALMKSYQPWLGARVTPTPQTVRQLAQNVEELCHLGINQFIIGMASGVSWPPDATASFIEQMLELYEIYLRRNTAGYYMRLTLFEKDDLDEPQRDLTQVWGCGAGRRRLCVNARGELYGCARLAALDNGRGGLKLGDVWRGPYEVSLRQDFCRDSVWRRPACLECAYQSQCNGGCPAVNYEDTGSIFEPSPFECLGTRVYAELKDCLARRQKRQVNHGETLAPPSTGKDL